MKMYILKNKEGAYWNDADTIYWHGKEVATRFTKEEKRMIILNCGESWEEVEG